MAEFALGLTKTAVEGTLSRVKLAIEEEGKQRERVQEDLMFITGEFQMMQAFLNASTAKERASKNLVARAWVRQLRDLAFDVEDCVEFVVHLDKPSPWDWVQRLASSLPCLARPLLPLDEAVGELKRLKARVEDVSQRNTRYNLMAGGGNNDDENQHQQQIMRPAGCHTSSAGAESFRILKDVWKAMGKLWHTTGDLKKLIDCQETGLKVISLWESPDADVVGEHGWASIVKTAYDDPEICQRFKNRAWIKLTSPFIPTEFLNNLLTHFTSHRHDRHDDMSKLMLQVSQHKYLIILEQQLSSVADWEAIKLCLPDGNNGSRIIVSTKDLGIARVSAGEPFQVWELKRISQDRSFWAFFPEGCGHRIGLGEFTWQLRQRGGVTSLYWWNGNHIGQFSEGVVYDEDTGGLRVFDGVKFERQYQYIDLDGPFKLADLARGILEESYKEDTRESVYEELKEMNDQNLFERCRKLLTEHDWLVYISVHMLSPAGWDLIEHYLLCESTRGCIVVFAEDPSLAKHCVGQQQHRALDLEDLVNKSGHSHGGGNMIIKEKSESELVGREGERDFFNPGLPIMLLSVWGIAGIGKSAIVRNDYSYELNATNYRMHGWVDVPDPFNLMVLCQRLLMDLHRNDPRAMETEAIAMMEGQDPIQRCCKLLHEKECYLVIDDLRSKHDWDSIKTNLLPQANPCGRTIVITRDESIAKHCTQERILNVTGLKDGMALFAKIALGVNELPSPSTDMLELIIYKCGGLPAIITAIGGELNRRCVHVESLHDINADFMGILERMSGLKGLFCWMKSYFDDCPDELKPCIFYMSVFPADQIIRRRRLLRRWIAEGYSSHGGGTTEETGEELLCKLMELSILYQEQQASSAIRGCKVNGFFQEYIKSRQMEDNLVFALEGSCGPSSRLIGQHLTISSSWDRDESVFNSIDLSRLRSLTVFGEWKSFLVCDKMKLLRVLDLESSSSTPESDGTGVVKDNDLEMIGEQFPRLKFMSLRGCIHITRLPNSLGAMKQLETLDVRHTSIVELPPAIITKLHKLQYIRAGTTEARRVQEAAVAPPPPPTPSPPPTSTTPDVHCGMSPLLGAKATALCVVHRASTRMTGAWKRRAHALVESVNSSSSSSWWWESKKQLDLRTRRRVAANGGGVEIPAPAGWIRTLTDLHTLGVLNVAGCGKDVFHALKKLTQLRKLGLSGVNRENWQDLCSAISVHVHLETLSLQLMLLEEEGGSYDFACFDDISWSSKTLKRLKVLYSTNAGAGAGCASIRPVWINQLRKLEGCRHDLTISYQQDIDIIHLNLVPISGIHLRIKPIEQHLSFVKDDHGPYWYRPDPEALRIDCSSTNSTVAFGDLRPMSLAELKIHCCSSCGGSSCLQVVGLQHIHDLKQVLVTGPCSDVFKEELRRQLSEHPETPELKLL